MNKSFEPEDFDAAIASKDYIALKSYIICSIRNDPGFYRKKGDPSEALIACKKLWDQRRDLPGLFSEYTLQKGEIEFDENMKNSWTWEYFIRQTFLLGENFCPERIKHIGKIGQYLTPRNFNFPQEDLTNEDDRICVLDSGDSLSSKRQMPFRIIVIISIAIIALLVGILAFMMI